MKKAPFFVLLFALAFCVSLQAQKRPELGRSPMMGWNSWNWFERNVTEDDIVGIIDAMDSLRMQDLGYEYIVIDGGWRQDYLNEDGSLSAHPVKFPHGIRYLADYAHSKGFKLGVHTVPGHYDCGCSPVGGWRNEALHVSEFVSWGLDFVKVDRCRFTLDKGPAKGWKEDDIVSAYRLWSSLLHDCGRDITFSICAYRYRPWYPELCNMARTTGDISHKASGGAFFEKSEKGSRGCNAVMDVADINNRWAAYAGNGYWNDPDMIPIGDQGLSFEEEKATFSLWCIMSSPLILGNDPRHISPEVWSLISCKRAIAIDQDPSEQGRRIYSSLSSSEENGVVESGEGASEVWVKHLSDGSCAVLLLNRSTSPASIRISLDDIFGRPTRKAEATEVYGGESMGKVRGAVSHDFSGRGSLLLHLR